MYISLPCYYDLVVNFFLNGFQDSGGFYVQFPLKMLVGFSLVNESPRLVLVVLNVVSLLTLDRVIIIIITTTTTCMFYHLYIWK